VFRRRSRLLTSMACLAVRQHWKVLFGPLQGYEK
jgi:hypothetical protein